MFKGAKKEDLRRIASELELCVSDKLTALDLMDLIKNCDRYKNDPDSVHELANLIIEERKYDESQQLEIQSSASGSIPVSSENKPHCGLIKDNADLEKTMRRFWEIENVEPETIKNKETIICEEHFQKNHTRDNQRKLQRILWRENMDEPIKTFELSTVTYGTTSAPFLATRTLKQLALDESGNFPLGLQL
ncbi:integrase catalytic domain-containing protein [Trichonephila clavipes]|nr:integrase catalytic domain-containing protein [Trichonephila clavipes]